MFSSTIIPTINRSTLSWAVQSVLEQDFNEDEFEVNVVNDSGMPLPNMPWMHAPRVRVVDTNRRERSVARNTSAAVAREKYLRFLVCLPTDGSATVNLSPLSGPLNYECSTLKMVLLLVLRL